MSIEDDKNTQSPQDEVSAEIGSSDLYKQKYGRKVLRQLTSEELGVTPTEVVTTPEGFNIHGVNKTSLIRSLKTLNGTPIHELEKRMRPAVGAVVGIPGAQRGGISMGGFLGSTESLTEVLGDDNDMVLGAGLTHQQLAEFLFYFNDVSKYLNRMFTESPMAFEYNDKTFVHSAIAYRGMQDSPFYDGTSTNQDHKIVCLEDGSAIGYSGLLPFMIHRYGFYEGKGVGYRLDPKKIAEVAGFISRPENDPIATLVQDNTAMVDITTDEQLWRMHNLAEVGVKITRNPNYRIVPENLNTLLTFLGLFGRRYYERNGKATDSQLAYRQNLTAHVVTDKLQAQPYKLTRHDYSIFTEIVPSDFPQLEKIVLEAIQDIELISEGEDKFATEQFLKHTLKALAERDPEGNLSPHVEYFVGLLQRIKKTPDNTLRIYDAAAKTYDPGYRVMGEEPNIDKARVHALAEALEGALPSLRSDILALYKQLRMPVSDNTSLEQLLLSKESMENYKKAVSGAVEFAKRVGGLKTVSESDMGTLLRVLVSGVGEKHQYTDDELTAMKRLNIDPSLIPYAFKAVGAARPSADMVIAQLYNGAARKGRELEQVLTQLPSDMDEKARAAAKVLIKRGLEPSYTSGKVTAQDLISRLHARAEELKKAGKGQDTETLTVTEGDVVSEYLGLLLPPFKDFLASSLVKRVLKSEGLDPIVVTLNRKAIAALPEIEVKDLIFGTKKYHQAVIGGKEYIFDSYGIKSGKFRLDARENEVSLYLRENRY